MISAPLMLVLMLLVVQFAVWLHATHIAQASAAEALTVARGVGGTTTSGQAWAESVLERTASGMLLDPDVNVTATGQRVRVRVHGAAAAVLPWPTLPVDVTAAGPVETWSTGR